jgi:hypothetical protein
VPVPLDIPQIFLWVGGFLVGGIVVLILLGLLVTAYTYFRRCTRHCLISQRDEGWGGRKHLNQTVSYDAPDSPALDAMKRFFPLRRHQAQLPEGSGNGADPLAPHDEPAADPGSDSAG